MCCAVIEFGLCYFGVYVNVFLFRFPLQVRSRREAADENGVKTELQNIGDVSQSQRIKHRRAY